MSIVSKINPDIQEEREKVGFDVAEFTNWYHGGVEKVEEKRFLGRIASTFHPFASFMSQQPFTHRKLLSQ